MNPNNVKLRGAHLHIVFEESGDDPLVLESWWDGDVNRERPDLLNVGRARPRLRALSILLLMAQFQQHLRSSEKLGYPINLEAPVPFRVPIKSGTWISTLASDMEDVIDWIKIRLHIHDDELFLLGSPGSMHTGGKQPPIVEFLQKKLPLSNVHLSVRNSKQFGSKIKPLSGRNLLRFAVTLESKHWKESANRALHPEIFDAKGHSVSYNKSPTDDLLVACLANLPDQSEDSDGPKLKDYSKLVFRMLMEREFDIYRTNCQPLFSCLGISVDSLKNPYLWEPVVFSGLQIEFLNQNCHLYFSDCFRFMRSMWRSELATPTPYSSSPYFSQYSDDMSAIVSNLFPRFWPNSVEERAELVKIRARSMDEHAAILKIFNEAFDDGLGFREDWGLRVGSNVSRASAAGIFFVQQLMWIDFLNEICLPFHVPDRKFLDEENDCYKEVKSLSTIIYYLKLDAFRHRDLVFDNCVSRRDFLDAAEAGTRLTQAHAKYWSALHTRFLSLGALSAKLT